MNDYIVFERIWQDMFYFKILVTCKSDYVTAQMGIYTSNMDIEKLGVAKSVEMLILWHNQDPVDYYEIYRNEQIQQIQGNYNPFIDNPWLVDFIY